MNVELKCGTVPDVGNGSPVRLVKTFIGQGSPTAWLGTVKTHGPLKLSVTPMLGGFDVGQFTPAKTPDALLVQRSVYSLQFEPSPKCGQQLLVAKGVPGTQVGCQTEGTIAWFDTCICVPASAVTCALVRSITSCTRLPGVLLKVAVTVEPCVAGAGGSVVEKLQLRMS